MYRGTYTYILICTCTHIYTYARIFVHTYIYTYMHIYTHIYISKFRFLPQIFGGMILFPIRKSPPLYDSYVQTAVGIAVTDHCRHLLIATIPRWAPAASFA